MWRTAGLRSEAEETQRDSGLENQREMKKGPAKYEFSLEQTMNEVIK